MEKAHTGVVRAKDAEVERILVKDAETEKEIAGLHLTVGQLESDLKASEEMVSGLQFDVERLYAQHDEAVAKGKEVVDKVSKNIMSQV